SLPTGKNLSNEQIHSSISSLQTELLRSEKESTSEHWRESKILPTPKDQEKAELTLLLLLLFGLFRGQNPRNQRNQTHERENQKENAKERSPTVWGMDRSHPYPGNPKKQRQKQQRKYHTIFSSRFWQTDKNPARAV